MEAIRNDDDKDLVATYLASFVLLPGDTQTSQLLQIIQGRTFPGGGTRTYAIPVSGHKSIHLCATSTKNIFELCKEAWNSLPVFTEAHGGTSTMRSELVGNKNKSKASAMVLAKAAVVDFLTDIGEMEGGPYPTWLIRQLTDLGIQNSDSEVLELPSWLTKRKLYGMFMCQQGVIAKADAKGPSLWLMKNRTWNGHYVPFKYFGKFGKTTVHTSKSDHDVKTLAMSATQSAMNFDTEHLIMDKKRMVTSKIATQRTPSLLQLSIY